MDGAVADPWENIVDKRHGCQSFIRSCSSITGCYSHDLLTHENSWPYMHPGGIP